MRSKLRSLSSALFVFAALSIVTSFGQSLSIARKPDNKYWVEASATAEPLTVQVSANFHLWIDEGDVTDQFSVEVQNPETPRFYRLAPQTPELAPIRVLLLGDSMVADCCGWGAGMYGYWKPSASVINYAQPWTSSKVFLQTAEFEKMLLIKPNYVIMQYAYSDIGLDPDRNTTPQEFADNLRFLIDTVRGFNGTPILLTLHADRIWDADGNLIPSDHPYNGIIKEIGAEKNVHVIDLYKLTRDLFTKLGKKGCEFMTYDPLNTGDGLHVSHEGAVWVSQLIMQALPDNLGVYMSGVLNPPPPPPTLPIPPPPTP